MLLKFFLPVHFDTFYYVSIAEFCVFLCEIVKSLWQVQFRKCVNRPVHFKAGLNTGLLLFPSHPPPPLGLMVCDEVLTSVLGVWDRPLAAV